MHEKRSQVRCGLDDDVHVTVPGYAPHPAQVMDVSPHGIRVRYDEELSPGAQVSLDLDFLQADLPDHTITVQGVVMHRFREPGGAHWQVGLKLLVDDEVQRQSLLGHLASCRSSF